MKKVSLLLSILMVFSLALAACTPTPTEAPAAPVEEPVEEPAAPVEEPVEEPAEPVEEPVVEQPLAGTVVEFWHVYSDAPGEGLQTLVDEFNATNEYGITVEALNQGNYGDVEDKFNAGIQSGDLPDVVMAYTNSLADWYSVDSIIDLNPYINDPDYGLTADQMADLYPHLKAAGFSVAG